jgi:hypothetical protein
MRIRPTPRVSAVFTISGRASPYLQQRGQEARSGKCEKYGVPTAEERFESMGVSLAIGRKAYRPIAQPFRPQCP